MKEFADYNFRFDESERKFSERVENTVGKGEVARYEQFLLVPQCFQKVVQQTRKNQGLFGKGLMLFNPLPDVKILDQTKLRAFTGDKCNKNDNYVFDRVENIVGKREIACTSNFSFSHNVFKRLLSQTRQKMSLCGNATFYK